jgi:hypothetical protein
MTLRRFAGLLASALMMHLNTAAGGAACATHSASAQASSASGTARHSAAWARMVGMTGMARGAAQHDQPGDAPCQAPSQAKCCQAMASCSAVFVGNGAGSAAPPLESTAVISAAIDAPHSVIAAPDPPPPKA